MESFGSNAKAIVIGANGGIGSAFIDHLNTQHNFSEVIPFARSTNGFDLCDESTIIQAAKTIADHSIDLIIIATGYLGTHPEKSLKQLSTDQFHHNFAVNTIGPALVIKHFAAKLRRDSKSVLAVLSARVGSINDNHLGGWYAYRAAKAALNMTIRCAAIELARTHHHTALVGLHPGTVDTSLSAPFQGQVKPEKLFTPPDATSRMLSVIDSITATDSGFIFAYDGQKIPY